MLTHTMIVLAVSMCPSLTEPEPPAQATRVMARITAESIHGHVVHLANFGTRHTLSETESQTRGIGAARRWIKARFEGFSADGGETLDVSFERFEQSPMRRVPEAAELVNVVAVLPGSMPEAAGRLYYVIGHYDSRNGDGMDAQGDAPGANDDGSGTAVVLELARVLAGERLDATVVFMATAGEEQGLLGARHHAAQALARGADIRGVLSNDIVGDPSGPALADGTAREARGLIRVMSEGIPRDGSAEELGRIRSLSGESDSVSRQLARFIAEVAELHGTSVRPMLVFRPDRFLRGGDHTAFNQHGYAAVRFTEVYEDYSRQHQDITEVDGRAYGDVAEYVDAGYLADVARLNAAAIVHLANAPSVPGNARIITARLSNDTTLRWEASPEPDTAGYEIVWRETTSPVWTDSVDVGNVTEYTIELSKDNHFFGVRAYDGEGYKSPVAFPVAARR
ncbi:MAG: M28 family metallopeptidase [Planctomycetes bacterium]|nr:M28 family metallopeptidase [Planctomycetota bacterium]